MTTGILNIDLNAIAANWAALDALSGEDTQTAAVVKADAYGLGAAQVGRRLVEAGVTTFFVAVTEEGAALRKALGDGPEIAVFSGHMSGDTNLIRDNNLIPMINSPAQLDRHLMALPDAPFGIQLDTGMNRLGMEQAEWDAVRTQVLEAGPWLVMSHLACADDPANPKNADQLASFRAMTDGLGLRRSLSATGGILLGEAYHFDLTRPGVGLYGGDPFEAARPVVELSLPVVQCRDLEIGEIVGYSGTWIASTPSRIATVSAGYADGLIRQMSNAATLYAGETPCPLVGRVSMDLLTIDVSHLSEDPEWLQILGPHQGVDDLATVASTIGYEILTSLGSRYARHYNRGSV